jgi:hypothetical protein
MRLALGQLGDPYDTSCPPGYTQLLTGACVCESGVVNSDGSCGDSQPVVAGVVQPIVIPTISTGLPTTADTAIQTAAVIPAPQAACQGLFQSSSAGTGLGECVGGVDLGTWLVIGGLAWMMFGQSSSSGGRHRR